MKKKLPMEQLEKIASDDYSACEFASRLEQQGLIHAPRNLKESILLQSQTPAFSAECIIHQTSRRLNLFLYSLKVSFAVISALFLLFAGSMTLELTHSPASSPQPPAERTFARQLSQHSNEAGKMLRTFSEKLTTWEVFDYDK